MNNAINSASIANDTVRDVDIGDEPGVGMDTESAVLSLTTSLAPVVSVTLAVPTSGFVVVTGEAFAQPDFFIDGWVRMSYNLSSSESQVSNTTYMTIDHDTGPWNYIPSTITTTHVFAATAGSRTYTFNAQASNSDASMVSNVAARKIIAVFYPTAYGAVAKAQDAADVQVPDGSVGME